MSQLARKIVDREHLARVAAALARPLVLTNGVFDILHRGHVTYLEQARALGAALVVAVNSDSSVRQLGKGPDRPIHSGADRAWVLAALQSVDLVTIFEEQVPLPVLELVRPDIYVKGGDYDMNEIAEARLVRSWGGTALVLPFVPGHSTTSTVRRMRGTD
ncbi:MAG TPA: D-glycero-beta-D-manno-heptose 1-phosphate adenylyltransferase [Burkholderiaceae bacterium]|nr:D-glycero-beta-D-manno-heptose 1-phosphate adenylyltransferase [Burkholderiaceae bacterium]